jgi:hypothetical protein
MPAIAVLAIGSAVSAVASKKAAKAQVKSGDAAVDEQRRQYDQTREDQAPYLAAGTEALAKLRNPDANFETSRDYGFRRAEGTREVQNTFAGRGLGQSGNALRALTEYSSNLASSEFGNWWNRQAGVAGVGANTAADLGATGARTAANVSNIRLGQGDARASGVIGVGNALINAGDQGLGIVESMNRKKRPPNALYSNPWAPR